MANTTNLNLTKLAGTEKLKTFPSPYNENMDAIDSAFGAAFGMNGAPDVDVSINNLADGLAIIANGNTHAAVTSGQFVYVRNHGSLSEGLYTATANIAANGTLSGNNLTANAKGGLNALSGKIANQIVRVRTASPVTKNGGTGEIEFPDRGGLFENTDIVNAFVNISGGRQYGEDYVTYVTQVVNNVNKVIVTNKTSVDRYISVTFIHY